jgi:hypothetical protein
MAWPRAALIRPPWPSLHHAPPPADFLLLNWCAIQRIARRSRVLPGDREALLTGIGFDWTGADALS